MTRADRFSLGDAACPVIRPRLWCTGRPGGTAAEQLALGPLELDVHEVAPAEYHVCGEVPVPGQRQLDLSVRVTDFDLAEATFAAPVD